MGDSKNNTGDRNTGNRNTGDSNTGNWNTGNRNTGYLNTGDSNTGNRNTGDSNTGNRNTGNRNTGNRNTGNWNTGNRNTGYLNTNEPTVRIFNKDSGLAFSDISIPDFFYFETSIWIYGCDMSDKEKEDNPSYKCVDGYLKTLDYKEAWRNSWDKAGEDDREKLFKLPNFNAEIFKEISGIDVNYKNKPTINIGGVDYLACDIEEALKDIEPAKNSDG